MAFRPCFGLFWPVLYLVAVTAYPGFVLRLHHTGTCNEREISGAGRERLRANVSKRNLITFRDH